MVRQNGHEPVKGGLAPDHGGDGDDIVDSSTRSSSRSSIIMDTGNEMPRSSSSNSSVDSTLPANVASSCSSSSPSNGGATGGIAITSYSSSSSANSTSSTSSVGAGGERNSHEQPVIKRQRIEHERTAEVRQVLQGHGSHGSSATTTSTSTSRSNGMMAGTPTSSSSGHSSNASSACSSSTSLSSSPSCSSTKLIPSSLEHSSDDEHQQQTLQLTPQHLPPAVQLEAATAPPNHHHHTQHHQPQQQQPQQQQQHVHHQPQQHYQHQHHLPATLNDSHARFQDAIGRQCLCALDSGVLLGCFKAYCGYEDAASDAPATVLPLGEWPFEHLLRFLSNVQLLFDTYLKQNIKGNICAGVMELCNFLIRSDDQLHNPHLLHHHGQQLHHTPLLHPLHHHSHLLHHHHHHHHPHHQYHQLQLLSRPTTRHGGLATLDIDELIGLCSCSSKYLSYLAGRILSSFLIIVKDDPDDYRWLEKLVANLFDFGNLDLRAVRKINASLEVIKRIVEWKDETEHPLDEEVGGGGGGGGEPPGASSSADGGGGPSDWSSGGSSVVAAGSGSAAYGMPPLAENYFAAHYAPYGGGADVGPAAGSIFHPAGETTSNTSVTVTSSSSLSSSASSPGTSTPSKAPSATAAPTTTACSSSPASSQGHLLHQQQAPSSPSPAPPSPPLGDGAGGCRYVTLTDSESFDTSRIKFETINILGGKWSALVKHINSLIRAQANSSSAAMMVATETCILTFLRLWESIISVKANLSVVETQPFHSQLDSFQLLLLVTKNSVIYRQMLTLFNEALCYGSTLALQDLIPEEVGSLAHNIVRSVKDYRILDKMPKSSYSNHLGFLGYQGQMVRYQDRRLQRVSDATPTATATATSEGGGALVVATETCYDRTLLQKMALLVLKAVAVIVKEIRCDSSDSSVDSSDFDMHEIQMIERSIRDVVKKLETFLKVQLEFHPESHLSKVLIHLFDDQDDYLVEAMVCTLDVTSGISFRNNAFPELIAMLNPVYTFIEFSNLGPNITHLFLDLLISPETCFLLFLLRFLKYIRQNWSMFTQSCYNYYRHNSYSNAATLLQNRVRAAAAAAAAATVGTGSGGGGGGGALVLPTDGGTGAANANVILDSVMTVLISLRMQISRLVADTLFPYNITPILRLIENCESLYEGNELS